MMKQVSADKGIRACRPLRSAACAPAMVKEKEHMHRKISAVLLALVLLLCGCAAKSNAERENTCIISISCASILDNLELCNPEKVELVPEDGWILEPVQVPFSGGESAFDVLQRVCQENRIHMEFTDTPLYNSAYIEGIGNLYEFDCGETSGWMYKVNGWFPNYGCSRCQLQNGDEIAWVYTCDLGDDVGGGYAAESE